MEQTMVRIEKVTKKYGQNIVVDSLDLTVQRGEIMILVGPSGCGKTTTLKMINRLIEYDSGDIYLHGENVKMINPVYLRRRIGYVIQQVGLLPHLTIQDNISFVLKLLGYPHSKQLERAKELIQTVGLPLEFLSKRPYQLSGGQQQRVGVARALAADPELILMDEPFGAVDPLARQQLQDVLLRLQQSLHKTIIFVTHDIQEALRLGSRIAVMKEGSIVQVGKPLDIVNANEPFVQKFIGPRGLFDLLDRIEVKQVLDQNIVILDITRPVPEHIIADDCIVVSETGRYLGILSGDAVVKNEMIDIDCVKPTDLFVLPSDSIGKAVEIMLKNGRTWLPVLEDSNFVGVVSVASCCQ